MQRFGAATPADEIITRAQYNAFIAEPVRAYLSFESHPARFEKTMVIITTAGMPYRIEDTNQSEVEFADLIFPAGSDPTVFFSDVHDEEAWAPCLVPGREGEITAATVESELTVLWTGDFGGNPFGLETRMVNPYQGYRGSGVDLFPRTPPAEVDFNWTCSFSFVSTVYATLMEGQGDASMFSPGAANRQFNAGHIYLTGRLDGPKASGETAVFSVRAMLERAKRASDPTFGVNPQQAVAVLDHVPGLPDWDLDRNRVYNLDTDADFWEYEGGLSQPPDADGVRTIKTDYLQAFTATTGQDFSGEIDTELYVATMPDAGNLPVILDFRANYRNRQKDLEVNQEENLGRTQDQGIILLGSFGVNGDEADGEDYLLRGGEDEESLYRAVNGAVFASLESYNAVTLFDNVSRQPSGHGKLIDFIAMGGSGAIGHAFEPQSDAVIDNEFLFYNLLADLDEDGFADLTFVEAAFSGIPYLSWAEVIIGDPLMRLAYGPGGLAWNGLTGDVNNDGKVNLTDVWLIKSRLGGCLQSDESQAFEKYHDLYEVNRDGIVNYGDVWLAKANLGKSY